ncbi:hypothetical protein Val02_22290 [Virgisporangium aliadipatigenens]|uniref:Pentapeptide repeat-containing protein n=1 Tax=Virgisporangium aliadipatigenens TaxID=741659 RepID=A0A8J4DQ47_9ACTN|nr:pentapeptide repeat-containing protein [Virgisporangium aliadipatigenens]GIJ45343.1 hypothetical protein Val02_22290 [Virgisporangium aliadipatigenens]
MTDPAAAPVDPIERANERLREAAKWFVGSAAAVGAALVAGSQFTTIGRLPLDWPTDVAHARLWIAIAGAAVALTAIVSAMWVAVRILVPVNVLLADLKDEWDDPRAPAARFFRRHPKYLQGFADPAELEAERDRLIGALGTAADRDAVLADIANLDLRVDAVEQMATHETLKARFARGIRQLAAAAAVTAVCVVGFTWAANPPAAAPAADLRGARLSGAVLRDADLRNARLDNADLSGADLTGADLTGASIAGVRWAGATCPDGVSADAAGGTCAGHRRPG